MYNDFHFKKYMLSYTELEPVQNVCCGCYCSGHSYLAILNFGHFQIFFHLVLFHIFLLVLILMEKDLEVFLLKSSLKNKTLSLTI